jgi:hypothetical protein
MNGFNSFERLFLEKRAHTGPPKEVFPQIQPHRYSEATAAVVQGAPCCHHPHDASFAGRQTARVTGSWRLLLRFQRKVWETR